MSSLAEALPAEIKRAAALLELAEKVKAGAAQQQAGLLSDAWDALGPVANWTAEQARRFGNCIDAEAFESAALMLLPTDGSMKLIDVTMGWEPSQPEVWPAITITWYPPYKSGPGWHAQISSAATLGLTIAMAVLEVRARAMTGE